MIKVRGLNARPDKIDPDSPEVLPQFRRLYGMAVGNSMARSGNEAIEIVGIVSKLGGKEDDLDLEDAEFNVLMKKVGANEARIPAQLHGQMYKRLQDDEKAAGETKEAAKKKEQESKK